MKKILVFGNSKHINEINFTKINPHITTVGVNRIWYKFIPDYLCFTDILIYKDIIEKGKTLNDFKNVILSEWILRNSNHDINKILMHQNTRLYYNINKYLAFPDSVSSAIMIYDRFIRKPHDKCKYYIAGVDLKWSDEHHFWLNTHKTNNNTNKEWNINRFPRMLHNWKIFKQQQYNIVSVNKNSMLNSIFQYEDINNLYD